MSEVKRLGWEACDAHNCHCDIVESKDGDMVNYEDYVALEKKLTDMAVQLANAESKCRELAAENAELKSYRPRPGGQVMMEALDAFEAQDDYPEGGMMDAFELLCCKHVETPATDDFLAEVRAQGVEMFAANLKVVGGHEHPYSAVANEFAAQLRKGAAI